MSDFSFTELSDYNSQSSLLSKTKSQAEILRKGSKPGHTPVLGKGREMLFNLVLQFFKESLNKA